MDRSTEIEEKKLVSLWLGFHAFEDQQTPLHEQFPVLGEPMLARASKAKGLNSIC